MTSTVAKSTVDRIWELAEQEFPNNPQRIELKVFHRLFRGAARDFAWLRELEKQLIKNVSAAELKKALEQRLKLVDPDHVVEKFLEIVRPTKPSTETIERESPPPRTEPSQSQLGQILHFSSYKKAQEVALQLARVAHKSVQIERPPKDQGTGFLVVVPEAARKEFFDVVGSVTEKMIEHRVAIGTFAATLMMLMDKTGGYRNIPEDSLVLEAFRRSDSQLADASASEIASHFSQYSGDQQQGVINNVKGIYHELSFVAQENNDGDEWTAEIMPLTNTQHVDVTMTNNETGETLQLQLKATDDVSYVTTAMESTPQDIEVLATEEVASRVSGVESSGLSNSEITSDVKAAAEQLSGASGELAVGEVLDSAIAGGAIAAGISVAKSLSNDEKIDGEDLTNVVVKVGFRAVLISLGLSFF